MDLESHVQVTVTNILTIYDTFLKLISTVIMGSFSINSEKIVLLTLCHDIKNT